MRFANARRPTVIVVSLAIVIAGTAAILRSTRAPLHAQTAGNEDLSAVGKYLDPLEAGGITLGTPSDPDAAVPLEGSFFEHPDHLAPVLVSFTACHMGTGDLDKSGCVEHPTYENRDAWVVVYPDVKFPIFGPMPRDGSVPDRPTSYSASACTFVDAKTGEILFTVSANA